MSTFPRGIKLKQSTISGATLAEPFLTRPTSDSNFKNFEFDAGLNSSAAWTEHLHEHESTRESESDSLSIDDDVERKIITGVQMNEVLGDRDDTASFEPGRPARVLYDFFGEAALKELRVRAGDELEILRETIDSTDGWSLARVPQRVGSQKNQDDNEIGLVPREYYAFTTDFISSPSNGTNGSQLPPDPDATSNETDASTPRASTTSPKGPPLIPQNTGEWFRQQMRSVLGGRSLNRFSRFVTSGAEEFVLRGAAPKPASRSQDSDEPDNIVNESGLKRIDLDGLPPTHTLRLSKFLSPEARGHIREPTAIPLESSPDAHYIDVGECGPTWRAKVPTFEVRVHSPEKRYPLPGMSSIIGGAAGVAGQGGEAGAYIVYSITSIFDSPPSSSDSDSDYEEAHTPTHAHSITVHRRFSHFVLLHSTLSSLLPGLALTPLPEKQYAGRLNADFVDARRGALQGYLRMLVRHPVVRYIEPLRFFLGCEDEIEWRKQLPVILNPSRSLPSSSSSSSKAGPSSFYANVYYPPFQIDLEDASETSDRFANHVHAVARGVQHMRGMFMRSVRQARVEMADAERSLGYEILGLLTGRLGTGSGDAADEEEEDSGEEEKVVSPTRSPNGRMRQKEKQRKGILNADGAWCWREECSDCLRLTKCMQKTAETLQGVADLYEDHARRTMLETEESMKDVAHPDAIYAPVLDIHRRTLERYKDSSQTTHAQPHTGGQKNNEASGNGTEPIHGIEEEDSVAARCETVLNTTLAEFDAYHNAKREDFERIVKDHLDGEIAFYEKVLARLRTTRALFDAPPTELDLLMPGARQPSVYERNSHHVNSFTPVAEPLTQPAPHVLDSGRRATIGPVSDAVKGLLGIAAGSGLGVNGVSGEGDESSRAETYGSVFGRLW